MKLNPKTNNVLIVDDDLDDQLMLKEALSECRYENEVKSFYNGQELLDYLNDAEEKPAYNEVNPGLIILDLNMPKKDGKATLRELRASIRYRHIPVIVLSTYADAEEMYKLGANNYIAKPDTYSELLLIMKEIKDFWF